MGLSSLNSALSGLSISQRQIDLISANVSNVGTEGYSRKILPQSTQAVNGQAVGVSAGTVVRNVNLNLNQSLWTEISSVGFNDIQASYLNRVSQFHGPPDAEISVAAEITRLKDSFSLLSSNPSDPFLQSAVVDQAVDTAGKINDFSQLITTLRNDAQSEITDTVRQINDFLDQIADLNRNIQSAQALGKTVAQAQDLRDTAVKGLSELIDISFFLRGDGTMVIQTNEGAELAGATAKELTFSPSALSPTIFYPDTAAGVYVGNPITDQSAVDITTRSPGGKIGGLLTLRDETFPKQMAQLDELAHKMATRFEAQGLLLYTNATGSIPSDTAPNITTTPEVAVPYVGFSNSIRVNSNIINNNALLQSGTNGVSIQAGSGEVIARVLDNVFGTIDHQQAIGTLDLSVSDNLAPNDTLQALLGVISSTIVRTNFRMLFALARTSTIHFPPAFFADRHMGITSRVRTIDHSITLCFANKAFRNHLWVCLIYIDRQAIVKT